MKRTVILTLAVAAAVMASKLLIEDVLGVPLEATARAWLQDPGTTGAVAIVALLALDVFLPVPSSVIMVLSGALFGVLPGAALALIGSIAGEWLGFELVRRYGHPMAAALIGDKEIPRFHHFFERHGVMAIIVTRPLPIVMETMSLVAGLSAMKRTAFLAASFAGTAPIVFVYAYAGAASREAGSLVPAAVILAAVIGGGWLWYRSRLSAVRPT
jgi:uncharacterized membrane protein YdjX (TVP38/TMEM64 family)